MMYSQYGFTCSKENYHHSHKDISHSCDLQGSQTQKNPYLESTKTVYRVRSPLLRIEGSDGKRNKGGANGLEIVHDVVMVALSFCGNSWR